MQKFIFSCLFIVASITFINAQSKFTLGIGVSGSLFIQAQDDPYLSSFSFVSPHVHLKYEPFSFGRFSGQVQANFYSKKIGLGTRYENLQGGINREGFSSLFLSGDLVLSVAYNHPISKTLNFQPRLGYFFSFNQLLGNEIYSGTSGGGGTSNFIIDIELEETPFFFYPGIMTGFSIDRFKNRSFIFFMDFYISPRNSFTEPLVYKINGEETRLQGKFHYVNVGIRYGLDKL